MGPEIVAGDILFYFPHTWTGELVARATDGPFSHCGIAVAPHVSVEALGRGITAVSNPVPDQVASVGLTLAADRHRYARKFLFGMVGKPYGVLDIAADVLKAVLPQSLGSRTPFLVSPSALDCSDLATRFLLLAGYRWLPVEMAMDTTRVSPNDLARALGLIKGGHE